MDDAAFGHFLVGRGGQNASWHATLNPGMQLNSTDNGATNSKTPGGTTSKVMAYFSLYQLTVVGLPSLGCIVTPKSQMGLQEVLLNLFMRFASLSR